MKAVNEEQKTMAKGTAWNLTGNLFLKVIAIFYTILLARMFPQEAVGVFYLALGIMYLLIVVGDLGLRSSFTRYFPYYLGRGEKNKAYNLLISSYIFAGALSAIVGIILFLCSGMIAASLEMPPLELVLKILSIFVILSPFFNLNSAFLIGIKRMKEYNLLTNSQNVLKVMLTCFFFLIFGGEASIIALAFVVSYVVFILVSFWYVKAGLRERGIHKIENSIEERVTLMKEVVPLGLAIALVAGIVNISFYMDRLMLGYLLPSGISAAQIGIYSISISMALIISLFSTSVTSIFAPVIAELYGKGNKEEMEKISQTAVRWNIFLLMPITITLVLFSKEILQLFYGISYISGAIVLSVFSIGIFFRMLGSIQVRILGAMRMVKIELFMAIIALILNIVLNLILIPAYGINGAAVASAISLASVTIMATYYCKKITGFSLTRNTLKPLLSGGIAFLLFILLQSAVGGMIGEAQDHMVPSEDLGLIILNKIVNFLIVGIMILLAFGIYFACILSLGCIEEEDWEIFFRFLKKLGLSENQVDNARGLFNH